MRMAGVDSNGCWVKHLWRCLIALPALLLMSVDVGAVATPRADVWQPNGPVYAVEMSKEDGANSVYIGGDFTYVGPGPGPSSGNAAAVSMAIPYNPVVTPGFNGPLYAVVPGPDGGWYVGGAFDTVVDKDGNSIPRNNLAQIDAEGNVLNWDPNIGSSLASDRVNALFYDALNDRLYVGGDFTSVNTDTVNDEPRNNLAAFDTTVDTNNAIPWNPNANAEVLSMAYDAGNNLLYVGGAFTTIDAQARNYIAALNVNHTTTPAPGDYDAGWDANVNNVVRALSLDLPNGRLYAGGDFTQVNGGAAQRNYLALFDTTSASDLGWDPDADASVRTLWYFENRLYIGGDFTTIKANPRAAFVVIDVSDITSPVSTSDLLLGGLMPPFTGATSVRVNQIIAGSNVIYVAWQGVLDGDLLGRMQVLDASDGAVQWYTDADGPINAFWSSGTNLLIGGEFTSGGGRIRSNLAEINISSGTDNGVGAATDWSVYVDGPVHSLESKSDGLALYIGGNFTRVGNTLTPRDNIALLSTIGTEVGASAWAPSITGTVVKTMALSPDETILYVGGDFTAIENQPRANIAALDTSVVGENGDNVLTTWNPGSSPGADGVVHALVVSSDGNLVFAGGDFTIIGGVSRSRVAAIRVSNGIPLSDDLWAITAPAAVNGVVRSLALSGDDKQLFLGGDFTAIDDGTIQVRNRVAALEVASGQWRVAGAVDPNVDLNVIAPVATSSIYSLALSSDDRMLWLGGDFTEVTNNTDRSRDNVARYNLSEAAENDLTNWNPVISGSGPAGFLPGGPLVHAVERSADDSQAIIGGNFTTVGATPAPHQYLAVFDTRRPTVINHVAGGFYNTNPLRVPISCSHAPTAESCSIFYTINGPEPTQALVPYDYIQPPPAPPEPPPPPPIPDELTAATSVLQFFARDAHGSVSETISVTYGIDATYPTTVAQPSEILPDLLFDAGVPEVADTEVRITLVCDDQGGANCNQTFYTTDNSDPHNADDGTPGLTASLYSEPLTPKQLLPLKSSTLADLTEAEEAVYYDMTLADIVTTEENAAYRVDLNAFTLGDIPRAAVALTSISLDRVREHVDLAKVRLDSLTSNILDNVVDPSNVPDDAETLADLNEDDLDLTQVTLGSIAGSAYSLDEIPAALAPPPTYILASQVPLIQVFLDRTEDDIVLRAVRRERVSLEQIPAEFIPGSRLYGLVNLQFFSTDRAGNSEVLNPSNPGAKSQLYYVDIGPPRTTAEPNTEDNVFTSEIHVVLTCYDFEDVAADATKLGGATGSGCKENGIFYTTNESEPNPDDAGPGKSTQVYTGPIPISKATVLRYLSVDNMGNTESAKFEVYAFTFSSVGKSGVGTSDLAIWLFALLGLGLRWRVTRAAG